MGNKVGTMKAKSGFGKKGYKPGSMIAKMNAKKKGNKMTAGAGSGIGRLQKAKMIKKII